ncbi:MAG TPA: DUF4256 domain-containing protein [Sphingobacterium bovisgrunnientis]|jgi:hypothetical protein|nr:DUF4256 domain-containing protein [Sphingobacterium bovisgrunnientis]
MKSIPSEQHQELLTILEKRFLKNMHRHPSLNWEDIYNKLKNDSQKLNSLYRMEETGGEPDVVQLTEDNEGINFVDCSAETPKGRRSICYDHEALESRKHYKPEDSAINMAQGMGIQLLNENLYFQLQKVGEFDLKTSSWLLTPNDVRSKGGALFGDNRFGRVFIYHNGADSYYGVRGFRGILKL